MDNNIIAVYGSPGSYKTTTALSLARCIASKGSNVVIVGTSTIKPLLPIAVPFESKFGGSLGKALSAVDFDRDVILKNIFMATGQIRQRDFCCAVPVYSIFLSGTFHFCLTERPLL